MTKVDQFESVFRASVKTRYQYEPIHFDSVLVITDLDEARASEFGDRVRSFLRVLEDRDSVAWRTVARSQYRTVDDLLELVRGSGCSLICTYRNLRSVAWKHVRSLGTDVDVLTQALSTPVVLVPHPDGGRASQHALENTNIVMAITDHLAGEAQLVNSAVRFTEKDGTIFLTHIEDDAVFERYMDVISKIPTIDTDTAREDILQQLLKEPHDYIRSCREALVESQIPIQIEEIVTVGHRISEYRRLVDEHEVDLLVMNRSHGDEVAMHGRAYPLAIELREIPLLLI